MLKKSITYDNPFTGEKVTEDHYFHISKADLIEMEMEENAATYTNQAGETFTGMQAKLARVVDSQDGKAIMAEFKDIVRRAYGKKEGDRFIKSKTIWEDFEASEAFSQLFFELATDADAAAEFVNGVMPGDLDKVAAEVRQKAAQVAQETAETPALAKASNALGTESDPTGLSTPETPRVLTVSEAAEMDHDELASGLADGRYKLS